jgi:hypothetical protein
MNEKLFRVAEPEIMSEEAPVEDEWWTNERQNKKINGIN